MQIDGSYGFVCRPEPHIYIYIRFSQVKNEKQISALPSSCFCGFLFACLFVVGIFVGKGLHLCRSSGLHLADLSIP